MSKKITIFHFSPEKLNLYGDRGNIRTLFMRCFWRGIELDVQEVRNIKEADLAQADILFIGGGSDREQALVTEDLFSIKSEFKHAIEDGVTALTICGGYQFLGDYYQTPEGEKLKGLGLLDFYTESKPGRLIGNILIDSSVGRVAGFENHGGRTYHNYEALGKVVKGHGNNGEDGKEGLVYKNLIGTYLHGPLLPKNPELADRVIASALERKYGKAELDPLKDELEQQAKTFIWNRTLGE